MKEKKILLFSPEKKSPIASKLAGAGFLVQQGKQIEQLKSFFIEGWTGCLLLDFSKSSYSHKVDRELQGMISFVLTLHPQAQIWVLLPNQSSSLIISAFRSGATDVILETENWVFEFEERMKKHNSFQSLEKELLGDLLHVNQEFFQILTKLARQNQEIKENHRINEQEIEETPILLVEPTAWLAPFMSNHQIKGFPILPVLGGGIALDKASKNKFPLFMVQEKLPDFSGALLLQNLLEQQTDSLGILFSPPTLDSPGKAFLQKGDQVTSLITELTQPSQFIDYIKELCLLQKKRNQERRYLVSFRKENFDILKKHRDLHKKVEQYLTIKSNRET